MLNRRLRMAMDQMPEEVILADHRAVKGSRAAVLLVYAEGSLDRARYGEIPAVMRSLRDAELYIEEARQADGYIGPV